MPADEEVRFLLAAAYARLRLRTASTEQLDRLSPAVQADQGVRAMRVLISQLPEDRVSVESRVATASKNVRALLERGVDVGLDLNAALQRWSASAGETEAFRADGGNVVRRREGASTWLRFADDAGAVKLFALPAPGSMSGASIGTMANQEPVVVEGADPPGLLRRVAELLPPRKDGYRPAITLVQADADEFLEALATADLSDVLRQSRLRVFVGPDAAARLAADLESRQDYLIHGPTVSSGAARAGTTPGAETVVTTAAQRQAELAQRLFTQVHGSYGTRDRAHWAARFREALSGAGRPLRVLLPTTRYSTFVQHSAADLAAALRRLGCDARVLIEPDDTAVLTSVAYLRAMADLEPDLVVLLNYTRANVGGVIPAGVPVVCWVQDAMPHLFDSKTGRAQGELDFLAGHTHRELFEHFGYSRERAIPLPVVASEEKFCPPSSRPVLDTDLRRLECEIAYVSHHSETPAKMHERLVREAGSPVVAGLFEALLPKVKAIIEEPETGAWTLWQQRLRTVGVETALQVFGEDPGERTLALVANQYVLPMADRLVRHQALRWAASIAGRRGWRLRIFGRGWDAAGSDPVLSQFAAGELEHGDALRISYQAAAAHLHTSIHWNYHQRVMECALAGGVPLCRIKGDDIALLESAVALEIDRLGVPAVCRIDDSHTRIHLACDRPESLMLAALMQRLGHERGQNKSIGVSDDTVRHAKAVWEGFPSGGAWLLGDISETGFWSESTLEAALERAITMPRWREQVSSGIASRVRARFTYTAAAGRILSGIRDSLAGAGRADGSA